MWSPWLRVAGPWRGRAALALAFAPLASCAGKATGERDASSIEPMTPPAFQAVPHRAPDQRIAYGQHESQFGELRLPPGRGPHPVVVLVHGGCFKAQYANLGELGPIGDTLKSRGVATWNIEYRRLGEPGGGWPDTYLDVGRAIDHLRLLAPQYDLDLQRVVVVGHSAGGHLAMWAAARHRLPTASALRVQNPLALRGAMVMAGPLDLTTNIENYEATCRGSVITSLLGGTPATVPDRYAEASPIRLVPLGIPQVLVWGTREDFVPRPLPDAYAEAARRAGDPVRLLSIPGAGHFEIAAPSTPTWAEVEQAIIALLDGRLPH